MFHQILRYLVQPFSRPHRLRGLRPLALARFPEEIALPRPDENPCIKASMSVLRIYTDEAGTMPMSDDDGPFVVSSVAVRGEHPEISPVEGRPGWLCSKLVELGASANCSVVIPRLGYGAAIQKKLEKMNVMARTTRLMTRANEHYLTSSGLQKRHFIYGHCMQDVIQGPLIRSVLKAPVEQVEIYFDEMTMARGTRRMIRTHVKTMRQRLFDTIDVLKSHNAAHAERVRANVKFTDIHIEWSNETKNGSAECGLKLAHYLASLKRRELIAGRTALHDELLQSGYDTYAHDRPEDHAIAQWNSEANELFSTVLLPASPAAKGTRL